MKKNYKPGTKAPASGQYSPCSKNGKCNTKKEVTVVKGKRLPPTKTPGEYYIIVDRSKNNSGKN